MRQAIFFYLIKETIETEQPTPHYAGFVNILGRPNVGKSTLMNALVGERMSIITRKPQTTRHRIFGILSGVDFQIVFSDTPGVIDAPQYKMQQVMNTFARSTFEDADLMLFVTSPEESYTSEDPWLEGLAALEIPVFVVVNKTDTISADAVAELVAYWQKRLPTAEVVPISALHQSGTAELLERIRQRLPEGPAYFPKDQLSDRSMRFFVSEIIREKIMEQYHQEIPYSADVHVMSYEETTTKSGQPMVRIEAEIHVERPTQKSILIGKGGQSIKALGTAARQGVEAFIEQKVFLALHVKVTENWRDNERTLRHFGYQ